MLYQTSSLEERFFSVPLHVEGAGSMAPASHYPGMVRVTLRGSANSIYPVINSDIEAFIDLSGADEKGIRHFPVQVRKKGTALGVDMLEISVEPMEITIELDAKLSVFVDVAPVTQGQTAAGYELTKTMINPSRVRLEGPEKLVRRYAELSTEAVDLEARSADFTAVTRVVNPDQALTTLGENVVEFHGEVRPILIIRNFANVPVDAQKLDTRLRFAVPPVFGEMRLEGPQNELEKWIPGKGMLFIDCSGIIDPGGYDLPLQSRLPANFRFLGTAAEATALTGRAQITKAEEGNTVPETLPAIHVIIMNAGL
jgi:hypothetical protein